MASITKLNDTSQTAADRIQQRLDDVGFTAQYLVEELPIESDKLQNYLLGKEKIPEKILNRIADRLSVNVMWLRGEKVSKN